MYQALSEILPGRLFLSGYRQAENWDLISSRQVVAVVNVSRYMENEFPVKLKYLRIEVEDDEDENLLPHFEKVHAFIESYPDLAVLCHCAAGISRSPTVVISYLMHHQRMRLREAFLYVLKRRRSICPNPGFVDQLMAYEKRLVEAGVLTLRESESEYPFYMPKEYPAFYVQRQTLMDSDGENWIEFDEAERVSWLGEDENPARMLCASFRRTCDAHESDD